MADNSVLPVLRRLVRLLIQQKIEVSALRQAALEHQLLTQPDVDRHRDTLQGRVQPLLDQLESAQPHDIAATLLILEGPSK